MKFKKFFSCIVSLSVATLHALIVESHQILDVITHAKQHDACTTLIIFDIDNTVARHAHEIGSDAWFAHEITKRTSGGSPTQEAIKDALPLYCALQHIVPLYPVELITPIVIRALQEEHYATLALTARSFPICLRTIEQLRCMHIDFSLTTPYKQDLELTSSTYALLQQGIIFCDGKAKEKALDQFFNVTGYIPTTIIYVDDKQSYLKAVEQLCAERGITFVGIRYGYCDTMVKNFNPTIAQQQLHEYLQRHHEVKNLLPA